MPTNRNTDESTSGIDFVLPWERMASYTQMVEDRKQRYVAENNQKLAMIANMENEQVTSLPAYDRALENHYEQLHKQVGMEIMKYPDVTTNLEGIRALKKITSGYVNNPILINANKTKESYNLLKEDLKANRITVEDFEKEKQRYDDITLNGDGTTAFEYLRPNYMALPDILADAAKNYKEHILKQSPNFISEGYDDQQATDIVDHVIANPLYKPAVDRVKQMMTEQGKEITPKSLTDELYNQFRTQFKINTRNIYHERTSNPEYEPGFTPLDFLIKQGNPVIDSNMADKFIPTAQDGTILNFDGAYFGKGEEAFSVPGIKNAKLVAGNDYQVSSQTVRAKVRVDKQDYANGITAKFEQKIKEYNDRADTRMKLPALYQVTYNKDVAINQSMSAQQYLEMAKVLGINQKDAEEFMDNYRRGAYNRGTMPVSYQGTYLYNGNPTETLNNGATGQSGESKLKTSSVSKIGYNANALIFGVMYKHAIDEDPKSIHDTNISNIMTSIDGRNNQKNYMLVDGVHLNPVMGNTEAVKFNEANKEKAASINADMKLRYSIGADGTRPISGSSYAVALNQGRFHGLYRKISPTKADLIGATSSSEYLDNADALNAFSNELYAHLSKRTLASADSPEGKRSIVESMFPNTSIDAVRQYMSPLVTAYKEVRDKCDAISKSVEFDDARAEAEIRRLYGEKTAALYKAGRVLADSSFYPKQNQ